MHMNLRGLRPRAEVQADIVEVIDEIVIDVYVRAAGRLPAVRMLTAIVGTCVADERIVKETISAAADLESVRAHIARSVSPGSYGVDQVIVDQIPR